MSNLIEVLDLKSDPRFYAKTLAWLLDPNADHGLASDGVAALFKTLVRQGVGWLACLDMDKVGTGTRQRRGRWDVVILLESGQRVELLGGALSRDEVSADDDGRVVSCVLPPPGQPAAAGMPAWSWSAVAELLNRDELGRHAAFLEDLRDHLVTLPTSTPVLSRNQIIHERVAVPASQSQTGDSDHEVILSEDMSRAYEVVGVLGEGSQGTVFDVRVKGDNVFEGFDLPIHRAVLKLAKDDGESILLEEAVYRSHEAGLARLLDSGVAGGRRYVVLERLYQLPSGWFSREGKPARIDIATAVDIYCALLSALSKLQFSKGKGLVLGDIKPENILLRLSADGRRIETEDYLRHITAGAYEPVFADVGCAQDRALLREARGRIDTMLGTPFYLAPEGVPLLQDGEFTPGRYSPATDVYGLTLSFYTHLTGASPYSHRRLERMGGEERLTTLLALKRDGADPIDRQLLYNLFDGAVGKVLEEVLDAGLAADPAARASAPTLLNLCRDRFALHESAPSAPALQTGITGLKLRQTKFRRLSPGSSIYQRQVKATTRHVRRSTKAR